MINVPKVVWLERTCSLPVPRTPEPDLIMDDANSVEEFSRVNQWGYAADGLHLYHLSVLKNIIKAGDLVLDLGCGSGEFLIKCASVFPEAQFIGADLSEEMLQMAKQQIEQRGLTNVSAQKTDITNLSPFYERKIDVVMSTSVMHHLPNENLLMAMAGEINKVLKPDGGLYLCDFLRPKSEKTIEHMAQDVLKRSGFKVLYQDYVNSLKASYSQESYKKFIEILSPAVVFKKTIVIDFIMSITTPTTRNSTRSLWSVLKRTPIRKISFNAWLDFFALQIFIRKT